MSSCLALVNYFLVKLFGRLNMKVLILACLLTCATGQPVFPRLPTSVLLKGGPFLATGEKIVGGTEAVPYEFPWQISLQRRAAIGWSHNCGGSVYNENYIIDAAHCVDGTFPSSWRIAAGEHSLSLTSGYEQYRNVLSIRVHGNYNQNTFANDIALLKMDQPLSFATGKVGPISLPISGSILKAGTSCIVSGWGTTAYSGTVSDVLRKVALPVVSNSDCDAMYGIGSILPSMMCAGFVAGGADSCQGDSGGPLVMLNPNILVGVVSWGNGCAYPGYPGVYTRVSSFVNWIKTNAV
ncbi:trypsin-1-like [Daphnia carinata]|uniref:trypsin-1-like n=1 Tax=Daphnia carinata TaxID=120202 RepID=UPI00257DEEFD|nr:trypsin-1-like [Daphnia carinata]